MTKRILLSLAACGILQTAVWGALCTVGTVATYEALGTTGCTIGDKVFSTFSFSNSATGGAVAPTAAGVAVTPVTTAGGEIGLSFGALWTAGSGQLVDTTITFDVAVVAGGAFLIDDASTVQSSGGFTGNGAASVTEGICAGPVFPCTSTMNRSEENTSE